MTDKTYDIVVNSRPKNVSTHRLTFGEIVLLAYDKLPEGQDVLYTIEYERGQGDKPAGSLTEGHDVILKEGMRFLVTHTNRS